MQLLLCDDHRIFMQALTHALEARDHVVVAQLTTPREAVERTKVERPDVCIMDLSFPDGSGLDAVIEIVDQVPATKVLVLSGNVDARTASAVLKAGAHGLIGKDQPVDQIVRALARLDADELAFDPRLLRDSVRRTASEEQTDLLVRQLTPRERQVLHRLVRAETTRDIAEGMGITSSTARAYIQAILSKLGVHTRLQAVSLVTRLGLSDKL
jgi:two-component system nitrate/nitrite response regulator NarL